MTSMNADLVEMILARIGWLSVLLEVGLLVVCARNLKVSKWMTMALFGTLISLSAGLAQHALPWFHSPRNGMQLMQLYAMVYLVHLAGNVCFLVGLAGTLADVGQRLRIAAAMLDKPPSVNELH